MSKPPINVSLAWQGDLRFAADTGTAAVTLDGAGIAGPSPMQSLALGLAGCMAIDVVDIIRKGRHPMTSLDARLSADRLPDPPRRFSSVTLHYTITGDVPAPVIERAIQLSRDKYCSVWHSLRQDIAFETSFEVRP